MIAFFGAHSLWYISHSPRKANSVMMVPPLMGTRHSAREHGYFVSEIRLPRFAITTPSFISSLSQSGTLTRTAKPCYPVLPSLVTRPLRRRQAIKGALFVVTGDTDSLVLPEGGLLESPTTARTAGHQERAGCVAYCVVGFIDNPDSTARARTANLLWLVWIGWLCCNGTYLLAMVVE